MDLVDQTGTEKKDDDALMQDIASGELAMLGELYVRHSKLVQSAIRRFAQGIPDAQVQELSHDVFLLLGKMAAGYVPQGKFRAYLYGIAVRTARTWQRNQRLRFFLLRSVPAEQLAGHGELPRSPGEHAAMRETVNQMLSRLSSRHREVLILNAVEGFGSEEIADILGISAKTARTRLFRARKTLLENALCDQWLQSFQREL